MLPFKYKKPVKKYFPVKVCTLEDNWEFNLEFKATGQDLFNLICCTIGLRETWYFGLQYKDSNGFVSWLKLDRKIQGQGIPNIMSFMLYVKFYPEDIAEELIQEISQHLYFLQAQYDILMSDVYCPPEATVLLASYVVQSTYGDYNEDTYTSGMFNSEDLLPKKVIDQYQMTTEMWNDRIKVWYVGHRGMTKNKAQLEYLKIAQDLDMYGIMYFPIINKRNTSLWLGVTPLGINIYEKDNKLVVKTAFQWSEIQHVSYDKKKFIIKHVGDISLYFVFYTHKIEINKLVLNLCIGNHDLFMKRRRPDSFEVQLIKAQATEEKNRRKMVVANIAQEKQLRIIAEKDKNVMEKQLYQLQEQSCLVNKALRRSEETTNLLAEKLRFAEQEAMLLGQKAYDAEHKVLRLRLNALKNEEEKASLERKSREAEELSEKLVDESERRAIEANKLKEELLKVRIAEKDTKEELLACLYKNTYTNNGVPSFNSESNNLVQDLTYDLEALGANANSNCSHVTPIVLNGRYIPYTANNSIDWLTLEIEHERVHYREKSEILEDQIIDLKKEIEKLKVKDNLCKFDMLYNEQVRCGENKYSILKKVNADSINARVASFEDL